MKNLNTNESTSFESSLGSPTKPLQSYEVKKPKQLFFVNSIEDTSQPLLNTIINLGPPPKINPPEKKVLKNKIKYESELKSIKKKIVTKKRHILDFDALFIISMSFLFSNGINKLSSDPASHLMIYEMQKNHPSWNRTTNDYKEQIELQIKAIKNQ